MALNRIDSAFVREAQANRIAVMPYLTGGYPDLKVTGQLLRRFDALGVTAIEIGFPFSDSIADGPVIQDSFHRALASGLRVEDLFSLVAEVRPQVEVPLVAMVTRTIVDRLGLDRFVERASEAGFDGIIVPDCPLEEAAEVAQAADRQWLKHIMLVAMSTPTQRCAEIVNLCSGFVYQIAVAGITGERHSLADNLADCVSRLRGMTGLPICLGFGISTAEQVRETGGLADGVIVGSAIVRRITEAIDSGRSSEELVEAVSAFVGELVGAAGRQ